MPPETSVLQICPREMKTCLHTMTWTRMLVVGLFIMDPNWKHPNVYYLMTRSTR